MRYSMIAVAGLLASLLIFTGGMDEIGGDAEYDVYWYTVDGGGHLFSTGGEFELSGTVGQPDAGIMTGGNFSLTTGFWSAAELADINGDGTVDLLDYARLEACVTGPETDIDRPVCLSADLDRDNDVDLRDFGRFQAGFQIHGR